MDTEQILDLFSLGDQEESKSQPTGKVSSRKAIENLDDLWDESQYEDMHVDGFLKSL
jgi:TATA-binding protein-associated factor